MFFYSGMRRRGKLGQVHVPAIAVLAFALSGATTAPAGAEDEFAKGVDLSILKKAEDSGVVYRQGGRPADAIEIKAAARTGFASPQWNGPSWSSTWEDRALFDAGGNPRPAMSAFNYKPEAEGR